MNTVWETIPNQKFDIGRTINFAKCDCKKCDFLHCPKNNYAVQKRLKSRSVKEFFDDNKDNILRLNTPSKFRWGFPNSWKLRLSLSGETDLINEFMDYMQFKFPKGTYWNIDYNSEFIELVILRRDNPVVKSSVSISKGDIYDIYRDPTPAQERLAKKISNAIKELKAIIVEYLSENDNNPNVGWLSPEGRHYKCRNTEHIQLAKELNSSEPMLEADGWCKIISDNEFLLLDRCLTAEQRNWLSLNGYDIEEE